MCLVPVAADGMRFDSQMAELRIEQLPTACARFAIHDTNIAPRKILD